MSARETAAQPSYDWAYFNAVYRGAEAIADVLAENHKPEPQLKVWEWANQYRVLDRASSSEPGRYNIERTPYWKALMDDLSPSSHVSEIVVAKSAQVGFTEALINFLGYIIHLTPGPTIMVEPTEDMMKRMVEQRLDPLIRNTHEVGDRITQGKGSRQSGNRKLQKSFVGGVLSLVGANSPSPLSSMPARFVIMDEVDRYPGDIGGEGHACELAIARSRTFTHNRKIVEGSTPTIKDQSRIWSRLLASDHNVLHVPCIHCGVLQPLEFGRLKWEKEKTDGVIYECCGCNQALYEHKHKTDMLAAHEWRPKNPFAGLRGYHINALASPVGWESWSNIAREFEACRSSPQKLKSFVNLTLGEPWEQRGDAPPATEAYERWRVPYPVWSAPEGVLAITAGVDVQQDRLEMEVVGWGREMQRSWSIAYEVIPGSPLEAATWGKLWMLLGREIPCERGGILHIRRAAIDSGYATQAVYQACRKAGSGVVSAIKGIDRWDHPLMAPTKVDVTLSGAKQIVRRALQVWPLATSRLKQDLYEELTHQLETGERRHTWPEYAQSYFDGLLSEALIAETTASGKIRRGWKKIHDRNEPLDCRNYAHGAALIEKLNLGDKEFWDQQEKVTRRSGNYQYTLADLDTPQVSEPAADAPPPPQPRRLPPKPPPPRRTSGNRIKGAWD